MKNYYKMLGVSQNASEEEINNAFKAIVMKKYPNGYAEEDPIKEMEFNNLVHAVEVLRDKKKRAAYDEGLKNAPLRKVKNMKINPKSKGFFKKNKGKIAIVSIALASLAAGYFLGNKLNGSKKNTDIQVTAAPVLTTVPVDDTPEIVESEKLLTANNIDEKVQEILNDNKTKGLNIDPTFIKSALFITNIDYLDQEDIKKMWENNDLNMIEEIQNMYNYTSAVGTHNNNVALGQEDGQYISLAPLAYDEQDKVILEELNTEFVDLANELKNETMTSEEFQTSFKYITEFYTGKSPLVTDTAEYNNYSLTSGAGLLSEQYWPMFSVNYASSEFITNENKIDIKTLSEGTTDSPAVINGSKYLGSIINHEALACLEEEKTLTKTQ